MNILKNSKSFLFFVFLLIYTSCSSSGGDQFKQGQKLYERHCESCHMTDGTGLGANIPPLAVSDYLRERQDQIPCIIRHGLSDTILVNNVEYSEQMIAIPELTEFQMANIINFINHAWGNDCGFVTVESIRKNLNACN